MTQADPPRLLNKALVLIGLILISQCAGGIGAVFTGPAIPTWYAGLVKPSFNPPGWVFGPVWGTLYTMMGVAAFLVWLEGTRGKPVRGALFAFLAHLVPNTVWTILFFGLRQPLIAFIDIIILWTWILVLIVLFSRINKIAAGLLVPYLAWVSFASILNFSLWVLNR